MNNNSPVTPSLTIGGLITGLIGFVVVVAFIASFANLLLGGFQLIISGGDKENVKKARTRILNSFLGLFIVVAAWPVFQVVQRMFGVTILGANLDELLRQLFH